MSLTQDTMVSVRDSRIGECLWSEWAGDGFDSVLEDSTIFFTEGHVDIEHEIVRRALASALQRDGSADTLGQGYRIIDDSAITSQGYAGNVDGARDYHVCDDEGVTLYGDSVENLALMTWVEVTI